MTMGIGRGVLLLPRGFEDRICEKDLEAVMAHECAHIARRDFAKNLLYEFVACAVAYHPACRLMRRRIAETRELVCDELAAGSDDRRPEYAASLLRLATAMAAPAAPSAAVGIFDANILEERIMRLTTVLPKVSRVQRIGMAMVTACVLAGGAAAAAALPFDVTPQSTASHEKVYKIGGDVTPPVLIHSADAEYPKSERAKGKAHVIIVCGLVVNAKGMPEGIHVLRSGGKNFDKSAMDAIRQYRFSPAMRKGQPVAVSITIETNMSLY